MPGLSAKADELSRPEATPEVVGTIHNGMSVCLDDDTDMVSETDTDSQMIPSGNLLD